MMRGFILAALAALGLTIGAQPAAAQYLVVAACPNAAAIYATGQSNRVATVDIYGTVCTSGSGGGGGGAATIADGADVAEGATADAAATAGGAGTVSAKLRLMTTQLGTINTTLGSNMAVIGPTPDGTAASTNPVLIAGTTDGTATGLVAVPKVTAGGVLSVDGSASTQPVSAVSLPLPTGAATSALQSTINTTLGTPFQAGGSIGNTTFASTQSGTWNINNVSGTISLPTGAATSAAQTTMATNQTAVQAPVAPGAATATKANLVGGQYNSAVQGFTNGQQGSLQFDQRGGLLVQDGQAIPSVSVTSATTLFTVADTSGYSSASVQITSAGSATITYEISEDGTTWIAVNGSAPNATAVVSTSTTATQLIFPISGKQFRARVSAYTSGTVTVQGTLRKDAVPVKSVVIAGTPSFIGTINDGTGISANALPTVFEGRTTNKTAVTTGQYVRPIATSIGAAVNKPFQVPELDWSYPAAAGGISNTTTAVTMVAAAGAGIRNYITSIQLSAGALGAATEVAIRDGAGGTVIWRGFLSTSGGAVNAQLSSPIKSTANTLLEAVTLTATITGAVYVNAQGYQAP